MKNRNCINSANFCVAVIRTTKQRASIKKTTPKDMQIMTGGSKATKVWVTPMNYEGKSWEIKAER